MRLSELYSHPGLNTMAFYGDPQVLSNLKDQAENSPNKDKKVVMVIPGGGQQNVLGAALSLGLHYGSLIGGIDEIFASSSGAGVGHFMIGEVNATEIFRHINPQNKLFDPLRLKRMLDIPTLAKVFRDQYPLPKDAYQKAKPKLRVGLTDKLTGEAVTFRAEDWKNPISLVIASKLIPVLSGLNSPGIKIGDNQYFDGWLTNPLFSKEVAESGATDLLYFFPDAIDYRLPGAEKSDGLAKGLSDRGLLNVPGQVLLRFPKRINDQLDQLTLKMIAQQNGEAPENNPRIAIIAPKKRVIPPLCLDRRILEQSHQEALFFMLHLLDHC